MTAAAIPADPGPSNVTDEYCAPSPPTIDHRRARVSRPGARGVAGTSCIFRTRHPVVIYPASAPGVGSRVVIVLSPGTRASCRVGAVRRLWCKIARDWASDRAHCRRLAPRGGGYRHPGAPRRGHGACHQGRRVVHYETERCDQRVPLVRKAIDGARHPALLLVDRFPRSPPSTTATTNGGWT